MFPSHIGPAPRREASQASDLVLPRNLLHVKKGEKTMDDLMRWASFPRALAEYVDITRPRDDRTGREVEAFRYRI
jgi:hypothetical protein